MNQQGLPERIKSNSNGGAEGAAGVRVGEIKSGLALLSQATIRGCQKVFCGLWRPWKSFPRDPDAWYNLGFWGLQRCGRAGKRRSPLFSVYRNRSSEPDAFLFHWHLNSQLQKYTPRICRISVRVACFLFIASAEFGLERAYQRKAIPRTARVHLQKCPENHRRSIKGTPFGARLRRSGKFSLAEYAKNGGSQKRPRNSGGLRGAGHFPLDQFWGLFFFDYDAMAKPDLVALQRKLRTVWVATTPATTSAMEICRTTTSGSGLTACGQRAGPALRALFDNDGKRTGRLHERLRASFFTTWRRKIFRT